MNVRSYANRGINNPVLRLVFVIVLKGELSLIQEVFKEIDYKGVKVNVSNLGTVYINGVERKPYYNKDGYVVCSMKIPNKGWRGVGIHRLVATAFVPNPNNLPEVNHLDYDRANCKYDNLEWTTHIDNIRYSKCNRPNVCGANNPNYGNKKLSKFYKEHKDIALQKQSRKGIQNGRSRKITVYCNGEYLLTFDYIKLCCEYFLKNNLTNCTNVESIRGRINSCVRTNKPYKGVYTFKIH